MTIPQNKTTGELIPAVIIEFHAMSNLIFTLDQWKEVGGWKGFLKEYCVSIRDIVKKHSRLLNPEDFPTEEWAG